MISYADEEDENCGVEDYFVFRWLRWDDRKGEKGETNGMKPKQKTQG